MLWVKHHTKPETGWQFAAVVAFVVMMVMNWLAASTTHLGGTDTAAVSDSYPNLFAPAGYTFAVWGVIYLLLGLFMFRMFAIWKPKNALSQAEINTITRLFTITSLLNAAWLLAWQYRVLWLSVILMTGLLVALIRINAITRSKDITAKEWLFVSLPFSVYFGWITVATIANISTWLVSLGWDRWGQSEGFWMVMVLLVGATIGLITMWCNNDWAYGGGIVWGYTGILVKHLSESGWNGKWPSVLATLYILLPVLIVTTLYVAQRSMWSWREFFWWRK